jgi:hypothetical protein
MSEQQRTNDEFAFTVVEDDGDEVVIEVSEADYERERRAGVDEESLLKPGRYRLRRGGFLKRHPGLKVGERKSA